MSQLCILMGMSDGVDTGWDVRSQADLGGVGTRSVQYTYDTSSSWRPRVGRSEVDC